MKYDYSEIPEVGMVFNPATNDIINLLPFYDFLEEYGGTTFEAATRLEDKVNRWIRHDESIDDSEIGDTLIKLACTLKMMSTHNLNRLDTERERKP